MLTRVSNKIAITEDWLRTLGGTEGLSTEGYPYWDFVYDTLVQDDKVEFCILLRVHSPLGSGGECMVDLFDATEGVHRGIGLTKNWPTTRGQLLKLLATLHIKHNLS